MNIKCAFTLTNDWYSGVTVICVLQKVKSLILLSCKVQTFFIKINVQTKNKTCVVLTDKRITNQWLQTQIERFHVKMASLPWQVNTFSLTCSVFHLKLLLYVLTNELQVGSWFKLAKFQLFYLDLSVLTLYLMLNDFEQTKNIDLCNVRMFSWINLFTRLYITLFLNIFAEFYFFVKLCNLTYTLLACTNMYHTTRNKTLPGECSRRKRFHEMT